MNRNTKIAVAVSVSLAVVVVSIIILLRFFSDVYKPTKLAYAQKLGRRQLKQIRLTQSASADANIRIYANDMDDFMVETNAATAAIASYYPALIVTEAGTKYQFKSSADADLLTHNMMSGLSDLWDWGKGICHLSVWAAGLISVYERDSTYDWKTNMKTQLSNLKNTINNLPNMRTILEGYDGLTVDDGESTTMPPILLNVSVDAYIRSARSILMITKSFIEYQLGAEKLTKSNVDGYILNVHNDVAWLMWATNDVVVNRAVRALREWKAAATDAEWDATYFVVGTGVADAGSVVTPRGSCTSGNTSVMIIKHIISKENLSSRVIMYSGSDLTFDILPSVLNPQSISSNIAANLGISTYARMLKADLTEPNNALSTHFTDYSAKVQNAQCIGSKFTGDAKCPFSSSSTTDK